ncbi:MAG TPA: hypothetical protein VE270_10105 [Thermoleophilaceae bacterium]|nr:hypothetical protein [Thermoleophilaceae bacterium]
MGWTGLVNGFYNVVTFASAFALVWAAHKYSAKLVHAGALSLAALALFVFPHISNKYLLFVPMIGFGIAWASMMGVPSIIAVAVIPSSRYGVYMGIINMMIVIPMLLQTLTFGTVYDAFLARTRRTRSCSRAACCSPRRWPRSWSRGRAESTSRTRPCRPGSGATRGLDGARRRSRRRGSFRDASHRGAAPDTSGRRTMNP